MGGLSKIEVFGLLKEAEYHQAKLIATGLTNSERELFAPPHCCGMVEYEWLLFLEEKKQSLGGQVSSW